MDFNATKLGCLKRLRFLILLRFGRWRVDQSYFSDRDYAGVGFFRLLNMNVRSA